jgi:dihydrolipoamide dehydrogenase
MSNKFNVVVIGGGSAGLVSAYICAAVKAKVALVERNLMGGDCLNYGCVPSKALIRTSRFVAEAKKAHKLGIKNVSFEVDFAAVMDRVHQVIGQIAPHDSVARYTSLGVDCFTGNAEVLSNKAVRVGDQILEAKNIILAVGASPFIPPIPGLDRSKVLTSENLWELRTLPRRLVVLGGGPIGCEMAQAFARLGSEVTIIEQSDRILPRDDSDVSELVTEKLKSEHLRILSGCTAEKVDHNASETKVWYRTKSGQQDCVACDGILVAVGRRANTDQLDTKKLGIQLAPNGTIMTDAYLRANGSNIFACGDAAGPYQFTHTAAHQAWYCAVNALFRPFKKFAVDYRVIPWVTFTDPEVAHVGLNETMAKQKGISYEVTKYGVDDLDRAIAEGEDHGFVKVLTKPGSDQILGATIAAHNAGEMITEFIQAMKQGFGLNKILGTIHPYPTYSEANKFAAGNWKKAHAPEQALRWLKMFHSWRV